MYKLIIAICILFASFTSVAQIQRTSTNINAGADSSLGKKYMKQLKNKKDLYKDLDLTKEQRGQLKTIRQDAKAKREAIENDDTISDKEQKEKLKALRKETEDAIQKILTKEQWQKFIEQRKENPKRDL